MWGVLYYIPHHFTMYYRLHRIFTENLNRLKNNGSLLHICHWAKPISSRIEYKSDDDDAMKIN